MVTIAVMKPAVKEVAYSIKTDCAKAVINQLIP